MHEGNTLLVSLQCCKKREQFFFILFCRLLVSMVLGAWLGKYRTCTYSLQNSFSRQFKKLRTTEYNIWSTVDQDGPSIPKVCDQ